MQSKSEICSSRLLSQAALARDLVATASALIYPDGVMYGKVTPVKYPPFTKENELAA